MNIIKLSAIHSTNEYLKTLSRSEALPNFTVVLTFNQTAGRGQMGASWESEPNKNLTFSLLYTFQKNDQYNIFDVNVRVAVSLISVLKELDIPKLSIKWPNDILSGNMKIGGILIENVMKSDGTISSIIGIGINVNQEYFESSTKASSLLNIMEKSFDLDELFQRIVKKIKCNLDFSLKSDNFWSSYHECLFKKGIPAVFQKPSGEKFMGIIQKVNTYGRLCVLKEDDSLEEFDVKTITLLY